MRQGRIAKKNRVIAYVLAPLFKLFFYCLPHVIKFFNPLDFRSLNFLQCIYKATDEKLLLFE
ncbi:hypothetical protein PHSC3_000562 [Chlamydiales bacterium STE3]|nr:hypothetical protein PHSC3_000562 [Chlamydiales bacterium STE3]